MRTWLSFPTGIRRIRFGGSVNLNTRASVYYVSATGLQVWRIGSAVMLAALVIWLIASREEGRLSENWLLVSGMVLAVRWLFEAVVVALFPPLETPTPARSNGERC